MRPDTSPEHPAATTVAALYVETGGAYFGLSDVDPWDEERDARLYAGPWPVVAHPPCTRWSIMGLCRGYGDGDDGGCFESALNAVRTYGGVLEHPRLTLAWREFGLARPSASGWTRSLFDEGWTCEVDQGRYGHDVYKPTWLYFVGDTPPPALVWNASKQPRGRFGVSHHGGGRHDSERGKIRSRTPAEFRDVLLDMARSVRLAVVA